MTSGVNTAAEKLVRWTGDSSVLSLQDLGQSSFATLIEGIFQVNLHPDVISVGSDGASDGEDQLGSPLGRRFFRTFS